MDSEEGKKVETVESAGCSCSWRPPTVEFADCSCSWRPSTFLLVAERIQGRDLATSKWTRSRARRAGASSSSSPFRRLKSRHCPAGPSNLTPLRAARQWLIARCGAALRVHLRSCPRRVHTAPTAPLPRAAVSGARMKNRRTAARLCDDCGDERDRDLSAVVKSMRYGVTTRFTRSPRRRWPAAMTAR